MTNSYVIPANSDGLPNQDYIILAGGQSGNGFGASPGRAVVKGPNAPQGWDVRKGYALSFATLIPVGADIQKFSVVVTVWAGSQYEEWKRWAAAYLQRAAVIIPGSTETRALTIIHPMINDPPFGITECVINDVVALEEDADGFYSYEIQFLGYRKPIPAVGRTAAALPTATKPQPTARQKLIDDLIAKNAAYDSLAPPVPQ